MRRSGNKNSDSAPPADFDFSRSLQKLQPDSFFLFIKQYPHPEGTSIYVYRLKPAIDRRQAGIEDTNIEIIERLNDVDEEYLLRNHGSGKYHLKFTDANKAKGLTEVAKTTVEIYDPQAPPILNPIELVIGAPGNDKLVNRYISEGWTVVDNKLTPPSAADGGAGVLAKTVHDLVQERERRPVDESGLAARLVEMLERRNNGGIDDLEKFLVLSEKLRPAADPVQVEMMKVLAGMVRGGGNAPEKNPLEELRSTAAFLKEMGFGAGGGTSWVEAVAALPGILQYGALMVRELKVMRAADQQPAPAAGSPPAAAPAGIAAPAVEGEGAEMFGGLSLVQLKGVFDDAVAAFERGISGADFAHGLVCGRRDGEKLYETICAIGKEELLGMAALVPGAAEVVKARGPEIGKFLDEFIAYGEPEEATA